MPYTCILNYVCICHPHSLWLFPTPSNFVSRLYIFFRIGTLVTTPRFRHMLGGEILVISGPCIKENAVIEVTCGNGLQLECARLSDFSLKCVTPKLTQIGEVHFILTLTSNEDGSINEYSGQFTSGNYSPFTIPQFSSRQTEDDTTLESKT